MPLSLDYYYGNEAEQYSFYRIPKALFTDARFKPVSVEAKVFIYFTLEDALTLMGCVLLFWTAVAVSPV